MDKRKLKLIKGLADRGVDGEKETAQRMYKEFLAKNKKPKDTSEIKNAKIHLKKKIDEFIKRGWEKSSVKTILKEKFKISVEKIDDIEVARKMYEQLLWIQHLCNGTEHKKKYKEIINPT